MIRLTAVLAVLTLASCTVGIKPPDYQKIDAYYTRSSTVTIQGESGSVKPGAEVYARDQEGRIAATATADAQGAFEISFCAGPWARENFDCEYEYDMQSGDWLRVEYTIGEKKSLPLLVQIR